MKNHKVWFEPLDKWDIIFENDRIKHSAESQGHLEKKKDIASDYIDKGYEVGIEVGVSLGYIVDVVAVSGSEYVAIEVGVTNEEKLSDLENDFTIVEHVGYSDENGKFIKDLTNTDYSDVLFVYLIPILGGSPEYDTTIGPPPIWEKEVESSLIYVTNYPIPNFHKDRIGVGVKKYPRNTDIKKIKQDLGI